MKVSTYKKGYLAEWTTQIYLWFKGYTLLYKRFNATAKKTGSGEIDLIFKKRKTLIFCEVKYRKSQDDALYAVSKNQQARIRRGAQLFLKRHPKYRHFDIRFDVIALASKRWPIHIKNAF
ncbi:MAG: YraN family protein [Alphaproteobacteria bacterium]|nr:YraN family protein [Alphaproteobacteria bacterium]